MPFWLESRTNFDSYNPRFFDIFQRPYTGSNMMGMGFSSRSNSIFLSSIKNGEIQQLKEELELKEIDVNKQINDRYPLHYAADYGQVEVIKYLLTKGAKVNVEDSYGVTPLLAAIWEGRTKCVEVLLENGARKTGHTPDGKTYIEAAEKQDIKTLLRKG